MRHEVEKPTADRAFDRSASRPPRSLTFRHRVAFECLRSVDLRAVAEIMNAADEIVPVGQPAQFIDPSLTAAEEIALETEPDGELLERDAAGLLLPPQDSAARSSRSMRQSSKVGGHGIVVGKANLAQAELDGVGCKLHRPACRVMAKRRVQMVVGKRGEHRSSKD